MEPLVLSFSVGCGSAMSVAKPAEISQVSTLNSQLPLPWAADVAAPVGYCCLAALPLRGLLPSVSEADP